MYALVIESKRSTIIITKRNYLKTFDQRLIQSENIIQQFNSYPQNIEWIECNDNFVDAMSIYRYHYNW